MPFTKNPFANKEKIDFTKDLKTNPPELESKKVIYKDDEIIQNMNNEPKVENKTIVNNIKSYNNEDGNI